MISVGALNALNGIRHGFFTRLGGVSEGIYASLNCGPGSNDERGHVRANRRIVASRLGVPAQRLLTLAQEHGTRAIEVTAPWEEGAAPVGDGLVTGVERLALGILTADCAPVLLADPQARIIGAAHAGWRGALTGIVPAVISTMQGMGARPERIIAAIGPRIGSRSYEVGVDLTQRFVKASPDNGQYFVALGGEGREEKMLFDLGGFLRAQLHGLGVERVEMTLHDTLVEEDRFFSYRRSVQRGEADYGRQISAIMLT